MVLRTVSLQTGDPDCHVAAEQVGGLTTSMVVQGEMQASGSGLSRPLSSMPYSDAVHSEILP